jgi:hypothetical protein
MKISSMRTSEPSTAVSRPWPRGQSVTGALCLIGLLGAAVACSGNVDTQPTSDTQSSRPAATPSAGIGTGAAATGTSGVLAPATTPSGTATSGSNEQAGSNVGGITGSVRSGGGGGGGVRARPRRPVLDAGADAAVDAGALDAGADAAAIDAGAVDAGAIDVAADAGG